MARRIYSILADEIYAVRHELTGCRVELADEGSEERELLQEAIEGVIQAEKALNKLKELEPEENSSHA